MLEWNIDRIGEGPMKAYKNLGSDLKSSRPHTANQMLGDMCSAILRARISNSTIDEIIKERKQLRDLIIKELTEIVKGWGVFLETVEITDVRICSRTLFSHMQTKFRETQKQTADLHKMQVDNEIELVQLDHNLEQAKRDANTSKTWEMREF
jgi:regulator of protease activity HflC (stomatin/prohibitin superfamily)